MALQMDNYITQYGVQAKYWKITKINMDLHYGWVDITVSGFASEQARKENNEPLHSEKIRANWSPDEFGAFFTPQSFMENPEPKEDNRPFMLSLKATLPEAEKPDFSQNIYERAYAFVKRSPIFKDCKDLI